ncbi:MAG: SDR family NAD(P)-dependent oxidoreductase [Nitrospirales bacterium]
MPASDLRFSRVFPDNATAELRMSSHTPPFDPSSGRTPPSNSRTVLVIGGSGGIGRAVCLEFGRHGWYVAIHYRINRQVAEQTLVRVQEAGGDGVICQADIRDADAVTSLIERVVGSRRRVDAAVCAAGQAGSSLAIRTAADQWQAAVDTNLTGTYHCLQAIGRQMVGQRAGAIMILGSFASLRGGPGQAAYAASKAGLLGLVRSAAREWGPSNVRVNLVFPGWQRTPLAGEAMPGPDEVLDHVLGRTPTLEAVARAVRQLADYPDGSGQIWNLDSRIF